jgi:hypothetical protein
MIVDLTPTTDMELASHKLGQSVNLNTEVCVCSHYMDEHNQIGCLIDGCLCCGYAVEQGSVIIEFEIEHTNGS